MENFANCVKTTMYVLFVFLGIKTMVVEVLFYLMVIDSLLGIAKALRLNEMFSFQVLAWGMVSKISLLIVPITIALMAKGVGFDLSYFVVAILNALVVNEGISCITNIITIKTGKRLENTDYITQLLNSIRKALIKIATRTIDTIEKG